jgi:hypothetical protein
VTDSTLDTPSFVSGTGSTELVFAHSFDLESGRDGAVLEISINGGPFTDIITAGGQFLEPGGYNGTISTAFQSPIAGRPAWTGNSGGYIGTTVQMPGAASFQNVRLRFRVATDCSGAGTGWRIDTIRATYPPGCPSATPTATATAATPTPTPCPLFNVTGTVGQCTTAGPSGVALAGVTITRTVPGGGGDGSTTTDENGNYFLSGFSCVTNTYTPSKAARLPGSAGIDTIDVVAVQRHFLAISLLTGCRLAAADCASPPGITTADVIAIQRFFLELTTGTGNVGQYSFTPASRSYSPGGGNQNGQNYDTIVFGDVAAPFANP